MAAFERTRSDILEPLGAPLILYSLLQVDDVPTGMSTGCCWRRRQDYLPAGDEYFLVALIELARQLALLTGVARLRARTLDLLLPAPRTAAGFTVSGAGGWTGHVSRATHALPDRLDTRPRPLAEESGAPESLLECEAGDGIPEKGLPCLSLD